MNTRRFRWPVLLGLALVASFGIGCSRAVAPIVVPRQSAVALTGGFNTSMVYLARTDDGVIAIDLGWWGHRSAVARALDSLGATVADVRWVFLTHSHRDHLAAWPSVRHAKFHIAGAEHARLIGTTAHGGSIPNLFERIKRSRLPKSDELDLVTFSKDTAIVAGSDTVHAFLVAGHTAGSAVYLFRGVLFLGDAVTYSRSGGFAPAKRGFSDDSRAAAESLARLWARLPEGGVRYVCTAHAHCAPFTSQFLSDVAR